VVLVTLASGVLARRLGQARVIGEIFGGILLGPSVLGRDVVYHAGRHGTRNDDVHHPDPEFARHSE
jgi:Kef-type K+ transport system membrane component KefB